MGVSTMSDYERNVGSAPIGPAMGYARPVAVDEGLRSYMLRIYNYMALGLAITGLAALGIYLLSVTGEMAAAAKIVRGGAELPARIAGNMYLTPLGYYVFVSPIKWAIMLAPLAWCLC
jgi:FtsH-binding integral membrane protein